MRNYIIKFNYLQLTFLLSFFVVLFCFFEFFELIAQEKNKITNGAWIIVGGDNVNVRLEPSTKSKILIQLMMGDFVKILRKKNEIINFENKKGFWVFVETLRCKPQGCPALYSGWLFDYYLAYENKYYRITQWPYKEISWCFGDYCPQYKFNANGSYSKKRQLLFLGDQKLSDPKGPWKDCLTKGGFITIEGDSSEYCNNSGYLHRFQNLIWAKGTEDYFTIDINNNLCTIPNLKCVQPE
jgi:hypothetical protein